MRVNKDIYPPRIVFEFQVVDAAGQTINERRRELGDLNYLFRVVSLRDDPLRYERELLQDWFNQELQVFEPEKTN